jgi:hypothetical protein
MLDREKVFAGSAGKLPHLGAECGKDVLAHQRDHLRGKAAEELVQEDEAMPQMRRLYGRIPDAGLRLTLIRSRMLTATQVAG